MAGGAEPGAALVPRALAVLGTFDADHREQNLTAIAERAGLPVPTVLRIVRQLAAGEALERTTAGTYVIGRRLWDLGLLARVQTELRELAAPYLHAGEEPAPPSTSRCETGIGYSTWTAWRAGRPSPW